MDTLFYEKYAYISMSKDNLKLNYSHKTQTNNIKLSSLEGVTIITEVDGEETDTDEVSAGLCETTISKSEGEETDEDDLYNGSVTTETRKPGESPDEDEGYYII